MEELQSRGFAKRSKVAEAGVGQCVWLCRSYSARKSRGAHRLWLSKSSSLVGQCVW